MSTSTRAAALLAAGACACACTIGDDGAAAPPSVTPSSSLRPAAAAPGGPSTPGPLETALQRAVDELGGTVTIAVAARGGPVIRVGRTSAVPAWSTSKVPLSMAALRRGGGVTADIRAAIVESDNDAAERIWDSFASPAAAAAATQAVLRDNGDRETTVPTQRSRAQYTAFGQTMWTDEAAARFSANIPCSAEGRSVLGLMRSVAGNQQWGLVGLDGAQSVGVKGGWGPDPGGAYLVRQLAVVQTARGSTGVMLSSTPPDGRQATGQAQLTRIARTVAARIGDLPSGRC